MKKFIFVILMSFFVTSCYSQPIMTEYYEPEPQIEYQISYYTFPVYDNYVSIIIWDDFYFKYHYSTPYYYSYYYPYRWHHNYWHHNHWNYDWYHKSQHNWFKQKTYNKSHKTRLRNNDSQRGYKNRNTPYKRNKVDRIKNYTPRNKTYKSPKRSEYKTPVYKQRNEIKKYKPTNRTKQYKNYDRKINKPKTNRNSSTKKSGKTRR